MSSQNPDPYKEWRQAGEGPHPTLAGNMFDPNVSADGKMRAGQGVGGTDESRLRQEGLEHIKKNTAGIDDSTTGGSTSTALPSTGTSNIGTSNTGSSTTGSSNIMSSTGGLSGTTSTGAADSSYDSTATSTTQDTGIMGTVKSWVGLGGDSTQTTGTTGGTDSTLGSSSTTGGTDSTLGGSTTGSSTSAGQHNPISQQSGTSQQFDPEGRVGHVEKKEPQVSTSKVGAMSDPSTTTASTSKDSDGTDPTLGTKSSDPRAAQQEAHEGAKQAANDPTDTGADKPPQPAGQKQGGGPLENKSSIPTAGGERLGEKHWGESKIVPDNPKPRAEENISSAAGQPDSTTASNTAANTGGATGGPSDTSTEEKEGIAGKIKDKLHIGGH